MAHSLRMRRRLDACPTTDAHPSPYLAWCQLEPSDSRTVLQHRPRGKERGTSWAGAARPRIHDMIFRSESAAKALSVVLDLLSVDQPVDVIVHASRRRSDEASMNVCVRRTALRP